MPLLVLSLLLWGLGARAGFDLGDTHAPTPDGRSLVSGILGFGGVVFGNTAAVSKRCTYKHHIQTHLVNTVVIYRSRLQLQTPSKDTASKSIRLRFLWVFPSVLLPGDAWLSVGYNPCQLVCRLVYRRASREAFVANSFSLGRFW